MDYYLPDINNIMDRTIPCIMLIDDDVATTVYNEIIIEDVECVKKVISMNSGEEALTYLDATNSDNDPLPNLILLDINMPTMDGWEFLEEFTQLTTNRNIKKPVIIMLSASSDEGEADKVKKHMLLKGIKNKPLTFETVEEIRDMYFSDMQ